MKRQSILFYLLLICSGILGQTNSSDHQWILKDGKGKSDYDFFTGNVFNNLITANKFSILGATHPNLSAMPKAGNSIFVIHDNGTPAKEDDFAFCSRRYSNNMNGSYPSDRYTIDLGSTFKPTFLYFTNHYEGDDPPKSVKVNNDNSHLLVNSFAKTKIGLNHNIVRGKDATLFINTRELKDWCSKLHPAVSINNFDIVFEDAVLTPSKIFNNPKGFAYHDVGSYINNTGRISSIPMGTYNNHFFNFMADAMGTYKPGDIITFTIGQGGCSYQVKDTIRDSHDPNFIKVACISKVGSKTTVKYRIECFNDGTSPVEASFTFTPPSAVDASTINVSPWCHGTDWGCGAIKKGIPYNKVKLSVIGNEVKFTFPKKGQLLDSNSTDMSKRKAWVEFCVTLKAGENIHTCNLQPTNPYTTFGGHTNYAIEKFEDLFMKNDNIKQRKITPNCKCDCLYIPVD